MSEHIFGGANVSKIHPEVETETEARLHLIERLQMLLQGARNGKLTGLAYVACGESDTTTGFVIMPGSDRARIIGAAAILQSRLIEEAKRP
jgi:hypothetical protein